MNLGTEMVTCPYNKAHAVLKSRLQFHLTKCRKNYPDMEKATCAFNSTHVVNQLELEHHHENCPDRGIIDNYLFRMSDDAPSGILPVPTFSICSKDDDESWEDTPQNQPSVLTKLKMEARNKGVLIPLIGASKSVKKNHRINERLRHAAMAEESKNTNPAGLPSALIIPESLTLQAPPKAQMPKRADITPPWNTKPAGLPSALIFPESLTLQAPPKAQMPKRANITPPWDTKPAGQRPALIETASKTLQAPPKAPEPKRADIRPPRDTKPAGQRPALIETASKTHQAPPKAPEPKRDDFRRPWDTKPAGLPSALIIPESLTLQAPPKAQMPKRADIRPPWQVREPEFSLPQSSGCPSPAAAHDFPTLGCKPAVTLRDNDMGLQDRMKNMTLVDSSDRKERPKVRGRGRLAPRQEDASISVPAGGFGGGRNLSYRGRSGQWQPAEPVQADETPTEDEPAK